MNIFFTQKYQNSQNKRTGFTLIENIIAFSILTITILAASNLLSNSIRQAEQNTLRLQAYLLSQQGLEAARNIRDSQWMQNLNFQNQENSLWGGNTLYPKTESKEIVINPIYNSLSTTNGSSFEILDSNQSQLYIDDSLGFSRYTHTPSDTLSPFKRTIIVSKNFNGLDELAKLNTAQQSFEQNEKIEDNVLLITSLVEYEFRGKTKEFSMQTILSDWKEGPL